MVPLITSWAPYHSTPTTLAETMKMPMPVRKARMVVDSAGGLEGLLGGGGEPRCGGALHAEGLHGANGSDRFRRIGRGVGQAVLRKRASGAAPHGPRSPAAAR